MATSHGTEIFSLPRSPTSQYSSTQRPTQEIYTVLGTLVGHESVFRALNLYGIQASGEDAIGLPMMPQPAAMKLSQSAVPTASILFEAFKRKVVLTVERGFSGHIGVRRSSIRVASVEALSETISVCIVRLGLGS